MDMLCAIPTGKVDKHYDHISEDEETVYFHLQDSSHEFKMGLKDILKCVKIAEEYGYVPSLPFGWWNSISNNYIEFRIYNEPPDDED